MQLLPKLLSLLAVIGGAFVDPAIAAPSKALSTRRIHFYGSSEPSHVNYCRKTSFDGDCNNQFYTADECQEISPGWVKAFDSFDCNNWVGCDLYTDDGCTGASMKAKKLLGNSDLGSFANNVTSFSCSLL